MKVPGKEWDWDDGSKDLKDSSSQGLYIFQYSPSSPASHKQIYKIKEIYLKAIKFVYLFKFV